MHKVTLGVTYFVDLDEYLYFAKINITESQLFGGACSFTHAMPVA